MKRKSAIWGGALAVTIGTVGFVSAMSPLKADFQEAQKSDKDQEKLDKELAELEAQKAKLESRIKDIRKKSGKSEERSITIQRSVKSDGKSPSAEDIHIIIEDAMKTAHKAMAEAMKNMPKSGFVFSDDKAVTISPDGKVLRTAPKTGQQGQVRILTDGDAKVFNFNENMSPEEKAKLKAAMDELHKSMKNMKFELKMDGMEGLQALRGLQAVPAVPGQPRVVAPLRARILNDDDTRTEIKKLREEVEKLRQDVKKQQDKKGGNDRETTFLEGYS